MDNLDRFILCRRRCIGRGIDTGLEAKFTRYLCILSGENLSTSRRP
jgi:hypothetical protein